MIIPQLSIFLENKSGRLTEVLEALGKENIRIIALSVAAVSYTHLTLPTIYSV